VSTLEGFYCISIPMGCTICYILCVPVDLMPGINDFLVVAIIPLLDYLVYPHLERTMGIRVKPMHKVSMVTYDAYNIMV